MKKRIMAAVVGFGLACGGISGDAPEGAAPTTPEAAGEALDALHEAAEDAHEAVQATADSSTCEKAYTQIVSLIEVARAVPGNQANPVVPSKPEFMEACQGLPPEIQRCMVLEETMTNPALAKDCEARVAALPAAEREATERLMEQAFAPR